MPSGDWTNFTAPDMDYVVYALESDEHGLYAGTYYGLKYLCWEQTNGLSPQSGSYNGGYTVRINGINLGNGNASDVYKVTLCGAESGLHRFGQFHADRGNRWGRHAGYW